MLSKEPGLASAGAVLWPSTQLKGPEIQVVAELAILASSLLWRQECPV